MTTSDGMPPDEFFGGEPAPRPRKTPPPGARPPLRLVTEPETRPDLLITSDVHLVTEAMCRTLVDDPELYRRGGELAHVIRADETGPGVVAGSPVARGAPLSWLIDRVSLLARCGVRKRKKTGDVVFVACPPPPARVKAVLERGEWPGMRDLKGILESPALRPDGTIVQNAGFDPQTGYLFEPNTDFLPVSDAPSHSDAVAAFARLREPFSEFPYVNASHLSAVLASVLTLLARPAIQGSVPCFLFDASAARSGKSIQVDVVHIIATGRAASRMTFPEQDDELEKVLAGYAIRGSSTVNFDNVARPFGGAALDKVITAIDKVDLRILGGNDLCTYDWRAVIFGSGNNVACKGDMLARVLSPRLETSLDNPELLDPTIKDLRAWTREHRAELVHAALTILRAYVVAGRPDMGCPRWGGFEPWSRLIPHALVWVGAADPMGARRGLAGDDDPERVAAAALVEGWERMCRAHPEGLTTKGAIAILYPPQSRHEEREPDGHDDLRESLEALARARPGVAPSSRQIGEALRKLKSRVIGGRKLTAVSASGKTARWRVDRA